MNKERLPTVFYVPTIPKHSVLPRFQRVTNPVLTLSLEDTSIRNLVHPTELNGDDSPVYADAAILPKHTLAISTSPVTTRRGSNSSHGFEPRKSTTTLMDETTAINLKQSEFNDASGSPKPTIGSEELLSYKPDADSFPLSRTQSDSEMLTSRRRCVRTAKYCKTFVAFLFSHIGLCLLVTGYCAAGAFMFRSIEQDHQLELMHKHSAELVKSYQDIQRVIWKLRHTLLNNCIIHLGRRLEEALNETSDQEKAYVTGQSSSRIPSLTKPFVLKNETNDPKINSGFTDHTQEIRFNMQNGSNSMKETEEWRKLLEELVNQSVELAALYSEDLVHAAYRACDSGWRPAVAHGFLQSSCGNCLNGLFNDSFLRAKECGKNDTHACKSHSADLEIPKTTPRMANSRDSWSLTGALLYALTVITTIGYGHIVPRTDLGRAITVVYALFGIPLVLLCLTNLGGFLADCVRFVYLNICLRLWRKRKNRKAVRRVPKLSTRTQCSGIFNTESAHGMEKQEGGPGEVALGNPVFDHSQLDSHGPNAHSTTQSDHNQSREHEKTIRFKTARQSVNFDRTAHQILHTITTSQSILSKTTSNQPRAAEVRVPIWFTLLVFTVYVTVGAIIFANWENWSFLQSAYFVFITLSTIGFGDFVPGIQNDNWYEDSQKPVFCCFYLLFGLSMIAMCFTLMQEEVKTKFRQFAKKIGLVE